MSARVHFVALRTGGLVLPNLAGWSAAGLGPSGDANIGLGLLVLGVRLLVGVGWAARDGARAARRGAALMPLVASWAVAVVLAAVLGAVWIRVGGALLGGGFFPGVLLSDLAGLVPFEGVLLGVLVVLALLGAHAAARPARPQGAAARR
ncbi:hypothetical protein [Quadrisphaera sp. DSM 44207]|uniref:hypothetical protein n=1 Tax=Quadrisphaera sp. DSM 44207 TaxID=1881057 RepID=UPI000880C006|nr:hypothetical protein [Quadrisphaera sp. DSM 44207]SDQ70268.1 hypothetical protein SAMN05428996_2463 [Quadrisphaera sp. DSM 44207]